MRLICQAVILIPLSVGLLSAQQVPQKEIFFAFFGTGVLSALAPARTERLQTEFTLTNPGERTAEVSMKFFARDGTLLQIALEPRPPSTPVSNPFTLAGHSSITVATILSGFPLSLGSVKIESAQAITALESINRLEVIDSGVDVVPSIRLLTTVAIESSIPVRDFNLSVVDDDDFGSGISLAALGPDRAPISGTLTLFDNLGRSIASRDVSVSGANQVVQLGSQLFPDLALIKNGTIAGQFNGEVIATSLKFGKGNGFLTRNLLSGKIAQ